MNTTSSEPLDQQAVVAGAPALALVTGGAHRLGRAIALALAGRGYAIGLHYHRSARAAQQTAAELLSAGAAAVYPLPADLRDPDGVDALFRMVAGLPHRLDVVVNSAATMSHGSLRDLTVEAWDSTLNLNLRAPWLCARAAARQMPGGGVIINLSDSGAHKAWTEYPAYVVSKAGLEALTRLLARTLAPDVRVNAVSPGLILPSPDLPPERWQRLVDRLPLRTAGMPEDVARAVLFLVDNAYITGQSLVIDGGYQLI